MKNGEAVQRQPEEKMTGPSQSFALTLAALLLSGSGNTFPDEAVSLMQRHAPLQQRFFCPESEPSFAQHNLTHKQALQLRMEQGPVKAPARHAVQKQVYLFVLVAPHAGSTAVSGLLASSPKVATLCSARTWACEGQWILSNNDCHLMNASKRWDETKPADWNAALKCYSKYWNLSQPVLMDKSPSNLGKAAKIYWDLKKEGKDAKFIMATSSPCLKVSPEFSGQAKARYFQMLLEAKSKLPSQALLHLRYEDLLQDPYAFAAKVVDFLPQLESVDPSKNGLGNVGEDRGLSVAHYIVEHEGPVRNELALQAVQEDWLPYMREFGYSVDGSFSSESP